MEARSWPLEQTVWQKSQWYIYQLYSELLTTSHISRVINRWNCWHRCHNVTNLWNVGHMITKSWLFDAECPLFYHCTKKIIFCVSSVHINSAFNSNSDWHYRYPHTPRPPHREKPPVWTSMYWSLGIWRGLCIKRQHLWRVWASVWAIKESYWELKCHPVTNTCDKSLSSGCFELHGSHHSMFAR